MHSSSRRAAPHAAPAGVAAVLLALALAAAGWWPQAAQAQAAPGKPIGFVKTVTPEAEVVVDGLPERATVGMPLRAGFRVRTGAGGSLGVAFRDDTTMSFGPNTEFVIDEYLYAPARDELRLSGTMVRGTMQYISGVIAKLRSDAVSIRTRTGVVGLRGTRVAIKVED